jgi:hypothetical protein
MGRRRCAVMFMERLLYVGSGLGSRFGLSGMGVRCFGCRAWDRE